MNYEEFKSKLKSDDAKILNTIYENLVKEYTQSLKLDISIDTNHNKLVNFLVNFFHRGGLIFKKSGYFIIRIDPLWKLKRKPIFDVLIYNEEGYAFLIECKSSVSNPEEEILDIKEKIKISNEYIKNLEEVIGNSIKILKYALMCPPHVADTFEDLVENAGIDLWSYDDMDNTIKISTRCPDKLEEKYPFGKKDELDISNDPLLVDCTPTSHVCNLLKHKGTALFRRYDGDFSGAHIMSVTKGNFSNIGITDDEEIDILTNTLIKNLLEFEIIEEETKSSDVLSSRKFHFIDPPARADTFFKMVEEKYVKKNVERRAKENALEIYNREQEKNPNKLGRHFKK